MATATSATSKILADVRRRVTASPVGARLVRAARAQAELGARALRGGRCRVALHSAVAAHRLLVRAEDAGASLFDVAGARREIDELIGTVESMCVLPRPRSSP